MTAASHQLLGVGLYTFAEASRITGVPVAAIRRWLGGYNRTRPGVGRKHYEPIVASELPVIDGVRAANFLDLVELRVIHAILRKHPLVSWSTIHRAYHNAQQAFGQYHPFANRRLRTDGRTVFAEMTAKKDKPLNDLAANQLVFKRLVNPLLEDIEFDNQGRASRWTPNQHRRIVIDPSRAFGQPIVASEGIATAVLAAAAKNDDVQTVAKWYDVAPSSVRAALEYEKSLSERAEAA